MTTILTQGARMKAQLVCDAVTMAMWQRKPKAGLIVHSDQGVQYAVINIDEYSGYMVLWVV